MREVKNAQPDRQAPGRPRSFDETEILSKIMELFWAQGYEGTALSDILSVTGLGKASLYKAFGNKRAVYKRSLAHYAALHVDRAVAMLSDADMTPLERVTAFLNAPIVALRDHGDRRGCFLCNASADAASLDQDALTMVQHGYDRMRTAIKMCLGNDDTQGAADLVLTVYSGLRIMARSGTALEALEAARDSCLSAITPKD